MPQPPNGGSAYRRPMTKKEEPTYTMKEALRDAAEMLKTQFGEADQVASVQLAVFLHGVHTRDEFMKKRAAPDERAFM